MDRGRFAHRTLPDPLTDMTIVGQADPQRLVIERMSCKCGAASIALAANRAGWDANAKLAMSARVIGFPLTERLETALPESHARTWKRFRPIGPIDAELQLTFDGQTWKPVVTADCR
jgi:hypothetical protein